MIENSYISKFQTSITLHYLLTWRTKSVANIGKIRLCKEKCASFYCFGNFVSKLQPIFTEIGNFVIKNSGFGPFLALAKNLTKLCRPSEAPKGRQDIKQTT
jgi:hypothetical protein